MMIPKSKSREMAWIILLEHAEDCLRSQQTSIHHYNSLHEIHPDIQRHITQKYLKHPKYP